MLIATHEQKKTGPAGDWIVHRPILFSAPMVRAILDGRKTQTRRVVKPQPPAEASIHYFLGNESWIEQAERSPFRHSWECWWGPSFDARPSGHLCGRHEVRCPYGKPGDRLWVRETWRRSWNAMAAEATGGTMGTSFAGPEFEYLADAKWPRMGGAWTPSIHMPRRASRLTLEVADVRVERLRDISDEDVLAEGLEMNEAGSFYVDDGEDGLAEFAEPRDAFAFLWDGINGKRAPFESNPWVWAITFRRLP